MLRRIRVIMAILLILFLNKTVVCLGQMNDENNGQDKMQLQKLQPELYYEHFAPNMVLQKDKVTNSPHRIIGGDLEILAEDKEKLERTIKELHRKSIIKDDISKKPIRKRLIIQESPERNLDTIVRNFIETNKDLLNIDKTNEDNLKLINIQQVKSKTYITYQQYYKDIPVYQVTVNIVINKQGKVPTCGSDYHKGINIPTQANITEIEAVNIAKQKINFAGTEDIVTSCDLFILPLYENEKYNYYLSYKLAISKKDPPASWVCFIDAHNGEFLIEPYNNIRHETISGKVTGDMLPEYYSVSSIEHQDIPRNVPFAHTYIKIEETDQIQKAEADGRYSFAATSGTYSLSASLESDWVKVENMAGDNFDYTLSAISSSIHDISLAAGGSLGDDQWQKEIAQLNVFYHINKIHDYVKNALKYDNMDFQLPAIVNEVNYDNAYYNDEKIEIGFGDGGSKYENFALFSDIIYHEYTHAVTHNIYVSGGKNLPYIGESGAIDEGLADYFACTLNGDSRQGEGVIRKNQGRNLYNTLKYPDDYVGEVHDDGMIIGGVFWDLSGNLVNSCGENEGRLVSDELIHNARFGYPVTFEEYGEQLLIVDDDLEYGGNDNIFDGTPHVAEIIASFANHNVFLSIGPSMKIDEYVRGTVNVRGRTGYIGEDFEKFELYCWKKDSESEAEKHLIDSAAIPIYEEDILTRWDTYGFDDGLYCLELKIITKSGSEINIYSSVTIDNVNDPIVFKECPKYIVFADNKSEFFIEAIDSDDPQGPFYSEIIYNAKNLPPQAVLNSATGLFSWIPPLSDIGKVYNVIFEASDSFQQTIQQEIEIYVEEKICIADYAEGDFQYVSQSNRCIYGNNFVYRNNNEIWQYDILNKENVLVYTNANIFSAPVVYKNAILWSHYYPFSYYHMRDLYMYDIATKEGNIIEDCVGQVYDLDTYEDKVIWIDDRRGQFGIWMQDIYYDYGGAYEDPECIVLFPRLDKAFFYYSHAIVGTYEDKVIWERDVMKKGTYDPYDQEGRYIYVSDIHSKDNILIEKSLLADGVASYEDKVIWVDAVVGKNGGLKWVLKMYNITTEEKKIIMEFSRAISYWAPKPLIYKEKIIYNVSGDIYCHDLNTEEKIKIISNEANEILGVYENNIVWRDLKSSFGGDIYLAAIPCFVSPPVFTSLPAEYCQREIGDYISFQILAVDPDKDSIELSAKLNDGQTIDSIGASFRDYKDGVGHFRWLPTLSHAGNQYQIVFEAKDNKGGSVSKLITIEILPLLTPQISFLSPKKGYAGGSYYLSIYGENFGNRNNVSSVRFGNVDAEIREWTKSYIRCQIPKLPAGDYEITVINSPSIVSEPQTFTVVPSRPKIDSINQDATDVRKCVISGSDFGQQDEQSKVYFWSYGYGEIVSWSDKEIVFRLPEQIEKESWYRCVVHTKGGWSKRKSFHYKDKAEGATASKSIRTKVHPRRRWFWRK